MQESPATLALVQIAEGDQTHKISMIICDSGLVLTDINVNSEQSRVIRDEQGDVLGIVLSIVGYKNPFLYTPSMEGRPWNLEKYGLSKNYTTWEYIVSISGR